jgi:hypothetical protein
MATIAAASSSSAAGSVQIFADVIFDLAGLCKDRGLNREAALLLRRVLALVPGHPGATRELRLLPISDRVAR